jgi:hypothetical protein
MSCATCSMCIGRWNDIVYFNVAILSNSSNILSYLPTLNVNLTSSCRFFLAGCKEEQAEDLACFGQTISVAYTSFDSSFELLWSHCTTWTL